MYGYIGAAVTTIISEIALFIMIHLYLLRCGYKFDLLKVVPKPLIAVSIAIALITVLRIENVHLHVLLELVLGGVVYLAVISILGVWGVTEIKMLKHLVGRRAYDAPHYEDPEVEENLEG